MRQIYEYHPVIGFRFIPDLVARIPHEGGGYLIRTNGTGFRSDRPFPVQRSGGKRRILLFGDSFTAGEGVSNGQRWGDALEQLLPDTEVYNFGLPATGTDQHYLIYEQYAREIEHDLLVIGLFVENVRRVASRYRHFIDDHGRQVLYEKPYFTLDGADLKLHGVPPAKRPVDQAALDAEARSHVFVRSRFPRARRVYEQLRGNPVLARIATTGLKERVQKLAQYQPIKEWDDPSDRGVRTTCAILARWAMQHSKPVAIVPIPLLHHAFELADASSYQRELRGACRDGGSHFVDPLEGLRSYPMETRRGFYFPEDHHLTKAGNEALALSIAPQLERLLEPGGAP
jgi:hypothetical protein